MTLLGAVDHLLLGCDDLERGIAWVFERTGVRPALGGVHPGRGTRNALCGLSGRRYLELLAPDPAQSEVLFRPEIAALRKPRLITWAAVSTDLAGLLARARASGLALDGPHAGSRRRPDGRLLEWRTLSVPGAFDGTTPFLIEWGKQSLHPSEDAPRGLALETLTLVNPEPAPLRRRLAVLGIEAEVKEGASPGLRARLATPKGAVLFE